MVSLFPCLLGWPKMSICCNHYTSERTVSCTASNCTALCCTILSYNGVMVSCGLLVSIVLCCTVFAESPRVPQKVHAHDMHYRTGIEGDTSWLFLVRACCMPP